jgi:2-haloacid dehalogenase
VPVRGRDVTDVKALVFDVFGTVVDWRGSVIAAGEVLSRRDGLGVDWGSFADTWRRDGYLAPIGRIVRGEQPWSAVENLMRRQLDELVVAYGLSSLSDTDVGGLAAVWHRLTPWPDAVPGLVRMREEYVIAPLSNGGFAQLTTMAKRAGLPWDCIISTEVFSTYKPDPRTYLGAADLLGLEPEEVMLVAAHGHDLRAAQQAGLRAAYVPRPHEWGPSAPPPEPPDPTFDAVADDFDGLATLLGA